MKTVLITGASGSIGTAIAVAFAKKGYAIALGCNRGEEKTKALSKVISESYGVPVFSVKADVSDCGQVKYMVRRVLDEFGHIDVLVNNAGIAQQKRMLIRHSGSIINISSMWGQTGASCEVHYSAAKAGVIGLTKALAKEVAPAGIRVNCIAPGAVQSQMLSGFTEEDLQAICDETPLGRLGKPKDIADAVVFLADREASFITGQVLGVNGGMVI